MDGEKEGRRLRDFTSSGSRGGYERGLCSSVGLS